MRLLKELNQQSIARMQELGFTFPINKVYDEVNPSLKDGVVILNFARDILVNTDAIVDALNSGKVAKYVTDFAIPGIVDVKNTIVIPHLGASTEESEDNCAKMAVVELMEFMENGNIY